MSHSLICAKIPEYFMSYLDFFTFSISPSYIFTPFMMIFIKYTGNKTKLYVI